MKFAELHTIQWQIIVVLCKINLISEANKRSIIFKCFLPSATP